MTRAFGASVTGLVESEFEPDQQTPHPVQNGRETDADRPEQRLHHSDKIGRGPRYGFADTPRHPSHSISPSTRLRSFLDFNNWCETWIVAVISPTENLERLDFFQ